MQLQDTIFDTADGLARFTRCLSAAVKSVKGSKVITAALAYTADHIAAGGYQYYGRYLDPSGMYWVGLGLDKKNPKLIFRINPPVSNNLPNLLGRSFIHIASPKALPTQKFIELTLVGTEFDTLAEPLTSDADRTVIIRDFLEEVKGITG
jgi:hypothetical protein